jgi:hypothetical protein
MSDVDRLFDQYREQHRSGGGADPRAYLEQLEGVDRDELAALIGAYLERAPGRSWHADEFAGSAAERLTERIAGGWEEAEAPVAWHELLPQLRAKVQIKRGDVVDRLAGAIGAPEQTTKVAGYYHQMETGKLPSEGVSNRVLQALAGIFGESAESLRAAGSVTTAGGGEEQVGPRVAFARTAVHNPEFADETPEEAQPAAATAAPIPDEDDLVDRLFTGGPAAGD